MGWWWPWGRSRSASRSPEAETSPAKDEATASQAAHSAQATSQATHGAQATSQATHGAQATSQATHGAQATSQAAHGAQATSQVAHSAQATSQVAHSAQATSQATHGAQAASQAAHSAQATSQATHGAQAASQAAHSAQATSQGAHSAQATSQAAHSAQAANGAADRTEEEMDDEVGSGSQRAPADRPARVDYDPVGAGELFDLMKDPHEGPVLRPFLAGRPVTAAERTAYRDYLLGREDIRGEALALLLELTEEPPRPEAAHKRARLAELRPQISSAWLRLVTEVPFLLNCGQARRCSPGIRFSFQCPRSWEELTPTAQPGVRHCGGCGEDVHRVDTVIAAEQLARQRKCIAVPAELAERGGYPDGRNRMITGRPAHPVQAWGERLFGEPAQ
jgi:hypothetical protein